MLIYSIQSAAAWKALRQDGVLRATRAHQSDLQLSAYNWMTRQLRKKVGASSTTDQVPLWGWAYETQQGMRDVRRHWMPVASYVQIAVEIDEPDVLVSDFEAWHQVLMRGYLARDAADDERFSLECQRLAKTCGTFGLRRRILASWQRIFSGDELEPAYWGQPRERSYQACFWEIRRPQVVESIEFRSSQAPDYWED